MEKKRFSEYSEEEKEVLLMHWWHYYGKMLITLAEMEKFHDLVKEDSELIKDVAMVSYILGYSSQGIIKAMRTNDLDNYFEGIRKFVESSEYMAIKDEAEDMFFEQLIETYNKPEPSVPMSEEQFLEELGKIVGEEHGDFRVVDVGLVKNDKEAVLDSDAVLTAEKVNQLYAKCSLVEDEVKDDEPLVDFVLGEGVRNITVFSAERIENNKAEIAMLFDELAGIDVGISFLTMCVDQYDRQWTGLHSTVDLLVQLGIASGVIEYTLPREMWDIFPGAMPYVIRNREKDNEKIEGFKPAQFKKIKESFEKK